MVIVMLVLGGTNAHGDGDDNGNVDESANVRRKLFWAHVGCLQTNYSPLDCIVCLTYFSSLGVHFHFYFPVRALGRF